MTRWQRFVICTNGETFDIDWTSYSQKGIMFVFYANIWSSIWFQQKSVPRINHVVFQGSTGFHTFVFVFNMIKTTFIGFQIFFWLNTSVIDFSNQQIWVMDFPKKLLLYWIIFPDMTDFQFSFHQIFSTSEDRDQLLVRAIKMFPFFCTSFLKSEWFLLGLTGVDWVFNCVIFFLGLWSIAAGGRPRRPGAPDDVDFSSVVSSQREEGEGKNEEERNHVTVKCNNRNMRKRRRRRRDEEWKKTWKTKTSSRRRRRCAGKWRSAGRASVFDRPPELSVLCVTSSPIARQQFGFVFFFTEFPRVFLAWTGPLEQPSFRTSTVEVGVPSVCSNSRSRNLQLVAVIDNVTDRRCGRVRSNGYRRFWCWSRFSISTVNSRADPARNERCRQPIGLTPSPVITWLFPNPFLEFETAQCRAVRLHRRFRRVFRGFGNNVDWISAGFPQPIRCFGFQLRVRRSLYWLLRVLVKASQRCTVGGSRVIGDELVWLRPFAPCERVVTSFSLTGCQVPNCVEFRDVPLGEWTSHYEELSRQFHVGSEQQH